MDNAVNLTGILGLEIGKPPSYEQLANLKEDIVWMEEKVVDGQSVLVPVVYLAKDYSNLKGANILAENISLEATAEKDNMINIQASSLLILL